MDSKKYDKAHEMVARLVDEAVNGIYKAIQDEIGVTTGDDAGIFHSGDGDKLEEELKAHFHEYVDFEKRMEKQSEEWEEQEKRAAQQREGQK
jgi:hypothetical protein